MNKLYQVRDTDGNLVLIGPMSTLRQAFYLREAAEERIERETDTDRPEGQHTGGFCLLCFNDKRTAIATTRTVMVARFDASLLGEGV